MENIQQNEKQKKRLYLTSTILKDFQFSTYWGNFISIFSIFIVTSFSLFYTYFTYRIRSARRFRSSTSFTEELGFYGILFLLILVGLIVLYILSSIALLRYSTEMKKAIQMKETSKFDKAITQLSYYFRFVGILFLALILMILTNIAFFDNYLFRNLF